MLTTREINFEDDAKQIVQLLKNEFGDRFTNEFFEWKHLKNPFGTSYGIVAVNEKNEVVGVRLFMWWQFKVDNEIKIAIRPVDTTTHKDYRGMGIFKNLTLTGIKELEGKYDLIFNTPNNNSLPGYLKMGWKKIDANFDYYLNIYNPFSKNIAFQLITENNEIPDNFQQPFNTTKHSSAFLAWRYQDAEYKKALFTTPDSKDLIVYKILNKTLKGISLKLILIVDHIGNSKKLKTLINSICRAESSLCYYFLAYGSTLQLKNNFSIKRGSSVVAYRSSTIADINTLQFSMGDLEGVL